MEYELSQHAKDAFIKREMPIKWVEQVLMSPKFTEPDADDATLVHLLGTIPEYGNRVLRVIVNFHVKPVRIVTFYFDRGMKGKL